MIPIEEKRREYARKNLEWRKKNPEKSKAIHALSKVEEQKKAFHFTNLQPLFAKDNLKKSNRMII